MNMCEADDSEEEEDVDMGGLFGDDDDYGGEVYHAQKPKIKKMSAA